jgi:predicted porin
MQKKVMALAVAGALAAPVAAFAQASNVQIYGRANVGIDNYSATGGTADLKSRTRVFDNGSRFGVRGSEDLGNGLKAIFQIESGVGLETGTTTTQAGSANSSAGVFASRDSYVGLEGGWGRVTMGRQSVYWGNGALMQFTANYVNTEPPAFTGANWGLLGTGITRVNNTVAYTSPTVGGFNGTVSYAPLSETAQAGASTNGRLMGLTLRYSGVVNAQLDYLNVKPADTGTTAPNGDIKAIKGGVGFPYAPGAQVAILAQQIKQEMTAATLATRPAGIFAVGDQAKQRMLGVVWEHTFGNIQALAAYTRLNEVKGASISGANTKSKSFMVGGRYLMSKRTAAYVTYNKTTNDSNQITDYQGAGYSASLGQGAPAGSDPRVWAVGLQHNF